MKTIDIITIVLVILGALNWGLVGVVRTDMVLRILGDTVLSTAVYAAIGLSGLYLAIRLLARPEPFLPHHAIHT